MDFLLQPCAFTSTYVARRAQHRMEVDVPQGSTVLWRFSVGDGLDIQFSAVFTPACSGAAGEEAGAKAVGPQPEEEERQQKGSRVVLMEGRFPPTEAVAAAGAEKEAGPGVVQGSFTAPTAGGCVFTWDNAFSRLRGKQVRF